MKIVKAFQCEFCPRARAYVTSRAVAAHEVRCFHNPTTRSCATCENLRHRYAPTGRVFGEVKDFVATQKPTTSALEKPTRHES